MDKVVKDAALFREAAENAGAPSEGNVTCISDEKIPEVLDNFNELKKSEGSPFDTLAFHGVIVRTPDPNLFGTRVSDVTPVRRVVQEFPNYPG